MLGLLPGRAAFASGESASGLPQDPPPLSATLTGASSFVFDKNEAIDITPVLGQGGVPPYAYSLFIPYFDADLSISPGTGEITGYPPAPSSATYTVTVTDQNGSRASANFTLTGNYFISLLDEVNSVTLVVNQPVTPFTPVTFTYGTPPLIYSTNPSLPAGLVMDSNGQISGTPTAPTNGTESMFVVVTDNATVPTQNSSPFFFTVNPELSASVVPSAASAALTDFTSAGFQPVIVTGGLPPYSFSTVPTLPYNLSIGFGGFIYGWPSEVMPKTAYTLTVTDAQGSTASASFDLTVNGPIMLNQTLYDLDLTQGRPAPSVAPISALYGTPPLIMSVSPALPTGLSMAWSTGIISGTPSFSSPPIAYTVTVTDANGATATGSYGLAVNPPVSTALTVPAVTMVQGQTATPVMPVTASGGTQPYAFTISPSLPSGLSMAGGVISGLPTAVLAASVFTITVTDANGSTSQQSFTLTVKTPLSAAAAVPLMSVTENQPVTPVAPVLGAGGSRPYSYSVTPALPAGLSLDAATGIVSGTPTVALASTAFTMTVTDSAGATASATFNLAVNSALAANTAIAASSLTQGYAAVPFTPVVGAGGAGALSFSVAPALPAGLSMAADTGVVSGTATVVSPAANYLVTVTDSTSATASAGFTLTVNSQVAASTAVASTSLTQNNAADPFTPVTGSGGTGLLTYSVAPALPGGLAMTPSTGAVSGTPTDASPSMNYTVTATDANGASATASFALVVNGPVVATPTVASTSVIVNKAVSPVTSVAGSGGTGALSYKVAPALPAGLAMAPTTGQISGTPTALHPVSSFTVTVADANGAKASADIGLGVVTLGSSVAVASSASPASYGQSVTFTATVTVSGGTPTGSVVFRDGAAVLATESVGSGSVSFATDALAVGSHAISATYSGDSTFASGTSQVLTQAVNSDSNPATSGGQVYTYQGTAGIAGSAKPDNTHFNLPAPGAIDTANGHLLVADTGNHRVQVLDAGSLAVVATFGTTGAAGSDNAHLNLPSGVGFDAAGGRIFVADTGNQRIQVFDAGSFAYLATLGTTGAAGSDNAHFSAPASAFVNAAAHQLYVADSGNQRVQVFDTASLLYVATLGVTGISGSTSGLFNQPLDAELNPSANQIMVADSANGRVELFDAATFAHAGTLGGSQDPADNFFFGQPATAAFDPASNLVLVADAGLGDRVQAFDAMSYTYVLTLGATGSSGAANTQFAGPAGIVADPVRKTLFIGDRQNDRVQVFSIAPSVDFAAVLPGSRSGVVGQPVTTFATMVNAGSTALDGCRAALPITAPAGLSLGYQTTDPATNALTGSPDTPATIPAGGLQSFLLSFAATSSFSAPGMALDFDCAGAAPAAVSPGVDTLDLAMSSTATADIIALAATVTQNGIVEMPVGGAGAFAAASANVGAAAPITVSADTGSATLPVVITLCQSNSATGQCLATPTPSVSLTVAAGATPSFSVFVQSTGAIAFAPATARVFLRFRDAAGALRGSTSVAIETE